VFASGLAVGFGGSTFIAAFVGGLLFGALRRDSGSDVSHFLEQGSELLNAATFVVFGAAILGPASTTSTGRSWFTLLSLTVVRIVPVAIAMIGTRAERPTVVFLGWSDQLASPRSCSASRRARSEPAHEQDILVAIALKRSRSRSSPGLSARALTGATSVRWYSDRTLVPPDDGSAPAPARPLRWPAGRFARAADPGRVTSSSDDLETTGRATPRTPRRIMAEVGRRRVVAVAERGEA
jgi:hypothetical protein